MNDIASIPVYVWIALIALLIAQGSWIFFDASKRGENKWLWGIFGLMSIPGNLIIYLIVTRIIPKKSSCPHCNRYIRDKSLFCPLCGKKI